MSVRRSLRQSEEGEGSSPARKRPRGTTETPGTELCRKHSRLLELYCHTDQQLLCQLCASRDHQGHRIGLVRLERKIQQGKLNMMQKQLGQMIQKHEEKQEDFRKMLGQIKEEAREAEESSETAIACVISSLQSHFQSVKALIRSQEEAAEAEFHSRRRSLSTKLQEMKRREAELNRLAATPCNVHFLQQWRSLSFEWEADVDQGFAGIPPDLLLPFKQIKDAVGTLGERLEEFSNKKFASLSQSVNSAEEDMKPQTREEFLQYACELSLDPSTAHDDLIVSYGNKEVKNQKGDRPVFRNPDRFIHRRQVLCREGLRAERCYFEVEVNGDKAEIALAYKGLNRKSSTTLSALGGNAMSWSLDISTFYSVSHKSESVQLTRVPRHPRIGVYLQFRKGALSFYEVADDMNFLYEVEAVFTEPLYPAFWLGDNCCIKICDLNLLRS